MERHGATARSRWWTGKGMAMVAFLAITAGGLGCGPGVAGPEAPSSGGSEIAPKTGGTLRFLSDSGAPAHMDVHDFVSSNLFNYGPALAYDRLVGYAPRPDRSGFDSEIAPKLAERWEQRDDTTYAFHLRKGVKFHDIAPVRGRELTAQDVVYSFNRQREPGRPNVVSLHNVANVEALDKYTVVLTVKRFDPDFLVELADTHNLVVAREAVELNGDLKNGPTIGAGPFILEKYEPGSGSYFTRNPAYYDPELPRLDRLEILTSFTDPAAALAAFRTKRVDVMRGVGAEDVEAVKRQHPEAMASLARHTAPKVITVRQDKPPFNDVRVRRALSKAVDRQQLIDAAYGGWGWLHTGVIPTGLEESELAVQGEEVQRWARRDLAEAKRLLAEAGYGSGLSIEMLVGKREAGDVPAAELLASQLKEAGVTANLRALENAQFVQQVLTRADYNEAAYGGRTLGTTVGQLFNSNLLSTSSRNADKINDPELDRLITEQATMRDKEQRKRVVLAIQRRALENANFITVAGAVRAVLIWPRVRDYWDGAPNENQRFAYAWLSE